jgi:tRNA(Arg) A34 adenosine deaminase TadA
VAAAKEEEDETQPSSATTNEKKRKSNHKDSGKSKKKIWMLLGSEQDLRAMGQSVKAQFEEEFSPVLFEVQVPVTRPDTVEGYNAAKELWPLSVPPPKPREPVVFEGEERAEIIRYMNEAAEMALQARAQAQLARGAVVVQDGRVRVKCHDHRLPHPPATSTETNGSPATPTSTSTTTTSTTTTTTASNDGTATTKGYHCLHHSAMVAIAEVGEVNVGLEKEGEGGSYLCSGHDLFLTHEPCIMCAMGVLHSRFKRVFYALPQPSCGALGSAYQLHLNKHVNHHFQVFRVTAPAPAALTQLDNP